MPLSERELIAKIRTAARRRSGDVRVGIGDDCAVLRPRRGEELLVTTDFSLEGIHFRREWHPPDSVGHRCLARGLSDIAAMGGRPIAAFLSLALPADLSQRWADRFLNGFLKLARQFDVTLAGGDIAQSPAGVLADIMVIGSAPQGEAVLRSGARVGDAIYVTGSLGASVAALQQLRAGKRPKSQRHFYPEPRIAAGQKLRGIATAMIDTSDGLSTDLSHICEESGVGAVIEATALPVFPHPSQNRARVGHPRLLEMALHGGEDYELLFTAREKMPREIGGVRITRIGEIVRGKAMRLQRGADRVRLRAHGWEHFT